MSALAPDVHHPTRWDVEDANRNPESRFLEHFRAALCLNEGEPGAEEYAILARSRDSPRDLTSHYTYPMALISSGLPPIPPDEQLSSLQESFTDTFGKHVFIRDVEAVRTAAPVPPYFQLALACMAVAASGPASLDNAAQVSSTDLFRAGVDLCVVMVEVDNREARSLDTVISATLLSAFGVLSCDPAYEAKALGIWCNIVTISRRMHVTDSYSPVYNMENYTRDSRKGSSLCSFMLLTDVLMAVAQNTPPNYSTSEIDIKMLTSAYSFRLIYNSLLHGFALPPDLSSREDAILLLVALLADIVYYQNAFQLPPVYDKSEGVADYYVSLSGGSEWLRISESLDASLSRWKRYFEQHSSGDMLVLYRFARMRLLAPEMVTYRGTNMATHTQSPDKPSGKTVSLAWEILDLMESVLEDPTQRLSMWLPLALFTSAVVVWKDLSHSKESMGKHGRLKMLSMFKEKLLQLPWPCCPRMVAILDRLTNVSDVG